MVLKLLGIVSSIGAVVAQSRSWFFPGGEINNPFIVKQSPLPSNFTIESWIRPTNIPSHPGIETWLNYAVPGNLDCMVVDKFDGTSTLVYVGGDLKGPATSPGSEACTFDSDGVLVIGKMQGSHGGGFDGTNSPRMYMDTLAVYDDALSAADIAAIADKECIETQDPRLVGAWYDVPGNHSGNTLYLATISPETTHKIARGCCSEVIQVNCFHGDGTVFLESGSSKRFSELRLGDVIRTSDGEGHFSFNPVLILPHATNSEPAIFLTLTTETGKSVNMTSDHFLPRCDFIEVTAGELHVGDCLVTVDGKETLIEISATEKNGIYSAVTQESFIVVDGIVASPYSKIFDPKRNYNNYLNFIVPDGVVASPYSQIFVPRRTNKNHLYPWKGGKSKKEHQQPLLSAYQILQKKENERRRG